MASPTTSAATSGLAYRRAMNHNATKSPMCRRPASQATPGRPNHSSSWAITTCGSHWVGVQSLVPNVVTLPGFLSDHSPSRNSRPKRRWK